MSDTFLGEPGAACIWSGPLAESPQALRLRASLRCVVYHQRRHVCQIADSRRRFLADGARLCWLMGRRAIAGAVAVTAEARRLGRISGKLSDLPKKWLNSNRGGML
jgi:hypothetical protein